MIDKFLILLFGWGLHILGLLYFLFLGAWMYLSNSYRRQFLAMKLVWRILLIASAVLFPPMLWYHANVSLLSRGGHFFESYKNISALIIVILIMIPMIHFISYIGGIPAMVCLVYLHSMALLLMLGKRGIH